MSDPLSQPTRRTGVLIAGAGPTGLLMACQLALRGVPFLILDKNEDHTTQSRALGVQARTLEIFEQMGIAAEAVRLGEIAQAVNLIVRGKKALTMPMRDIGTGLTAFPYLLILEQSKTEKILNDFLAAHGASVLWNTELVSFSQSEDWVTATIRHKAGQEETVQAEWLVGADGSHSPVRHQLHIPFLGKSYQQSLFVLDCEASSELPRNAATIVFSEQDITLFFPLSEGRCRVLGTVPARLQGQSAITFEDISQNFEQRVQMPVRLSNPAWISLYHAHHRVVASFRVGRCFVAGDAAHIHSPVGAQGMNTGLQDAYNLAWKLALVIQGKAQEKLLDSYHDERIAIAQTLVQTTDRAFNYANSQSPSLKGVRLYLLPVLLRVLFPLAQSIKPLRELGFRTISQIGIAYRASALSQQAPDAQFPRHSPKAGDRVPYLPTTANVTGTQGLLRGVNFHLILFAGIETDAESERAAQALQRAYPDLIDVEQILFSAETANLYRCFGIKRQGYYFIRPDGYIAYRSDTLELRGLEQYLKGWALAQGG